MGLQDIFLSRFLMAAVITDISSTARVTGTAAFRQIFPTVVFFVAGGGLFAHANNKKGKVWHKKGIEPRDISKKNYHF